MEYLIVLGLARRYFLYPTKIILLVSERNTLRSQALFRGMGLRVVTVRFQLGGFIGDIDYEAAWVGENIQGWKEAVKILAGLACHNPQASYIGLQKYLQKDWSFVQCVTLGIGEAFQTVEDALQWSFLLVIFQGVGKEK